MPPALLLLICRLTERFTVAVSLGSSNNTTKDTALTLESDILQ